MYLFYAVLNFTLSGALGAIGILTLKKVSAPKEVVFAALPLLFALHQFSEGFVWLGVSHLIEPRALEFAEGVYIFYAQGLLQFLVPLAIWLLESNKMRKQIIFILMIIGGLLTAYTVWGLSIEPTSVSVRENSLAYVNPWTDNRLVGITYVITTCGSLMLSSSIAIQLFGFLNLVGLTLIYYIKPYAFTSLWCFYAAVVSVLLYYYFVERRIAFLQNIRRKERVLSDILEKELNDLQRHIRFKF